MAKKSVPKSRIMAEAVAWAFMMMLVGYLNPFGFEERMDEHSQNIIERMTAPLYRPARTNVAGEEIIPGQDQIAVVMLSDQSLGYLKRNYTWKWPLPFKAHSAMLGLMAPPGSDRSTQPRAIFLDFLILDDLGKPDELDTYFMRVGHVTGFGEGKKLGKGRPCVNCQFEKLEKIIESGGVPVIIPATTSNADDPEIRRKLAEVAVLASISNIADGYSINQSEDYPSPAALLYYTHLLQICIDNSIFDDRKGEQTFTEIAGDCIRGHQRDKKALQQHEGKLRPIWGSHMAENQNKATKVDEGCDSDFTVWKRLYKHSFGNLFDINRDARLIVAQRYPYHLTVPVTALFEQDASLISNYLGGRYIFFGANLMGQSDYFVSPVHGELSGIYLHATALDNLIQYEMDYVEHGSSNFFHWKGFFEFLLVLAGTVVAGLWRRPTGPKDKTRRKLNSPVPLLSNPVWRSRLAGPFLTLGILALGFCLFYLTRVFMTIVGGASTTEITVVALPDIAAVLLTPIAITLFLLFSIITLITLWPAGKLRAFQALTRELALVGAYAITLCSIALLVFLALRVTTINLFAVLGAIVSAHLLFQQDQILRDLGKVLKKSRKRLRKTWKKMDDPQPIQEEKRKET